MNKSGWIPLNFPFSTFVLTQKYKVINKDLSQFNQSLLT